MVIVIAILLQGCISKQPFLGHWKQIQDKSLTINSFDGEYMCTPETSPQWYKDNWPFFFIRNLNKKMRDKFYHSDLKSYECYSFTIQNNSDSLVLSFYNQNKTKQTNITLYNEKDYVLNDNAIKFVTDYDSTNYVLGIQTSSNTFLKDTDGNLIIQNDHSGLILFLPIPSFYTYWAKFEKITN